MTAHDFLTTAELRAAGHTIASIRREIDTGQPGRVIKGWYATTKTDREAIRAMRLGGRLGCVSALRIKGAWCPPDPRDARRVPVLRLGATARHPGASRRRGRNLDGKEEGTGSAFPVVPIDIAVARMLLCQPAHLAIAVLDSLLFRRLMTENRLGAVVAAGVPEHMRFLADHLEPRSEEGIESIVRFRLAMIGITASVQVTLRSRDRLDLLIDDWLVLELDDVRRTRRRPRSPPTVCAPPDSSAAAESCCSSPTPRSCTTGRFWRARCSTSSRSTRPFAPEPHDLQARQQDENTSAGRNRSFRPAEAKSSC